MTLTGTEQPSAVPAAEGWPLPGEVERLTRHGLIELRAQALRIAGAGLVAADPRAGLARQVRLDGTDLVIAGRRYHLDAIDRVLFLGAGKATWPIAHGVAELLGDRLSAGLIVVQRGTGAPIAGVDVREADHPTPTEASHAAGQALLALAADAAPGDLVITAFTGGSSALACVPPAGVSFAAKQDLHRLLLACGAPIEQINAVRKHVSAIKGGRLAQLVAPAPVVNLTLPDVASGRLDCITDPTVPDESTVAEAIGILHNRGLWDEVDPAVRAFLAGDAAQSPDLAGLDIHTVLLSDGERACAAMSAAATALGLTPHVFGTQIEGEAATVGRMLAALALEAVQRNRPFATPCAFLGAGGESVVTLPGVRGTASPAGGPNQEVALGFAHAISSSTATAASIAAVFIDSDGSDGGTEHAGAIVDSATPGRAATAGLDLGTALLRHDSAAAFATLGDAIITGPTGTNISDLWAVVVGGAS